MKTANQTNRKRGETATKRNPTITLSPAKNPVAKKPRVLLYDVETSPNLAHVWGKYEQDALGDFVQERQVISVAWKWLGEKKVRVLAMPMLKSYRKSPNDNRALIMALYKLMKKADIVIGHNVDSFDDKMVNTEFICLGLTPPPPHKTIDTLKVVRKKFRFNSNKLGDLGQRLGLGAKVSTGGFKLWEGCLRGDKKSWDLMKKYNAGDVLLLEKIYYKLLPWITNHPDLNALDGLDACPNCKCTKLQRRGYMIVGGGRRVRFQCTKCGRWSKGDIKKAGEFKGVWKFQ